MLLQKAMGIGIGDTAGDLHDQLVENTGDILNTSRKATFTFPEGIEVVDIVTNGVRTPGTNPTDFKYEIDENVVTIYNYQKSNAESEKVNMGIKFIINAAPTFTGDVKVTLGRSEEHTSEL